jgi:hypothetical protein
MNAAGDSREANVIPNDVCGRVLCLRAGSQTATGFLIDVEERQYLVTARHFARDVNESTPLRVLFDNKWQDLGGGLVGHAPGEIDISVFALTQIAANPALRLNPSQAILYGQDVYFLGFPYGQWGDLTTKAKVERPWPFVRRALVSCIESSPDGAHRNYLAGHNLPGFSGGPVVWSASPHTLPPSNFQVTSVISGYQFVSSPIFIGGSKTDATYQENTGIIISYGIRHALDLINANPIGVRI